MSLSSSPFLLPPLTLLPLQMVSYLEESCLEHEGLLRIPGSTSRMNHMLQEMEATFHTGQFSFAGSNCNDVGSMLKQFIRCV